MIYFDKAENSHLDVGYLTTICQRSYFTISDKEEITLEVSQNSGEEAIAVVEFEEIIEADCIKTSTDDPLAGYNKHKIIPNPVVDFINIELQDEEEDFEVEVYNSAGHIVLKSFSTSFDVSTLMPGLYFVKISNANSRSVNKIIKS